MVTVPTVNDTAARATAGTDVPWLRAVVGGVVLGLAALTGNLWVGTTTLAQMAAPWLAVAAWSGAGRTVPRPRHAAMAGTVALLTAIAAYYIPAILTGTPTPLRLVLLWGAVATVVGPIAGGLGREVRHGPRRRATAAVVALAGAVLAEMLVLWIHIDHTTEHVVQAAVGLAAVGWAMALLVRAGRRHLVLGTLGLATVTAVGFLVLDAAMVALGVVSAR